MPANLPTSTKPSRVVGTRSPEKTVLRHKVLCIPYLITVTKRVRFLVVKDATFQEYTFVSGGLKRNELPATGAMRELREETKDAVMIALTRWNHKMFKLMTDSREPREQDLDRLRNEKVLTVYHVFVVDITNYKTIAKMMEDFKHSSRTGKAYLECDALCFDTLEQMKARKLWAFIRNNVLNNADFKRIYMEISKGCVV